MATVRLNGDASGYVELKAPNAAGSTSLILPTSDGDSGQVLSTDGSGALSWIGAGKILQVVETNYTASASSVTAIPLDNTIPQNTEGTQILSASITPASSSNKLYIQVSFPFVDADGARSVFAALFQDSTANALAGGLVILVGSDYSNNIYFSHYMTAGTVSSTTFKVRYGPNTGTAYINRRGSNDANYGNVCAARLVIMEIAA